VVLLRESDGLIREHFIELAAFTGGASMLRPVAA
jgi:hypothetical protein